MNQNNQPEIILSIITVVYNDVTNIEKTLKNIGRIKSEYIQYIVIDGNSNDGTKKILEKYKNIIDLYTSESDEGIYDAMNKGLYLATGKSVIFMNSGDCFYHKFNPIQTIIKYNYENTVLIGFSIQTYKGDTYLRPDRAHQNILLKNPAHQAFFAPKNKYQHIRFRTEYKIAADYYWIQEIMKNTPTIILEDIVASFSLGGKSTSKLFTDILQMNKEMRLKYYFFKSIAKFLIFKLLGLKNSFRIIYRNKYKLLN